MEFSEIEDRVRSNPRLIGVEDYELSLQKFSSHHKICKNGSKAIENQEDFEWVGLRVWHRRQQGSAILPISHETDISQLVDWALLNASLSSADPWFRFPLWRSMSTDLHPGTGNSMPLFWTGIPASLFIEEEEEVRSFSIRISRKTERRVLAYEGREEWQHAGLNRRDGLASTTVRFSVKSLERPAPVMDSNFVPVYQELVRAPAYRGEVSGAVVLHSSIMCELLSEMRHLFCEKPVDPNANFPAQLSSLVTIEDDGLNPEGAYQVPFDLEGVASQRTVIIKEGTWIERLRDTYCGARRNMLSTGSQRRRPQELQPRILPSTLVLKEGTTHPKDLLAGVGQGWFLYALTVLCRVTPTRVRMSAMGWKIDNTSRMHPYSSITLEFEELDVLGQIKGVASDIHFFSGIGSPSILFSKMP